MSVRTKEDGRESGDEIRGNKRKKGESSEFKNIEKIRVREKKERKSLTRTRGEERRQNEEIRGKRGKVIRG